MLEGNRSLYVWINSNSNGQRRVERADTALAGNSIKPLTLGAREALALVNGTSVSAALAALASHEALLLVSLAQLLTAMSVEGLRDTDESFVPFFSQVRPHDGQAECAANILSFLTGLPPNLVITEPSRSFIFKGTDILIAALLSELGFLANPVGTHVQTAEMGNQALNSLALISAQHTIDALDVLAQLAAAHLVAVCQALDLRAFHHQFIQRLKIMFHELFNQNIGWQSLLPDTAAKATLEQRCWASLVDFLEASTSLDSDTRISGAVTNLQPLLLGALPVCSETIRALTAFTQYFGQQALRLYYEVRDDYVTSGSAEALLGHGTKRLYIYVRRKLQVPLSAPKH